MTLDEAFAEYKEKFGSVPEIMRQKRGAPYEIIEELLVAVDTNEPIQELENIDEANL